MNEKKTAFLATPGFVPMPQRFGNADLLKAVGANSGNLMFQLAATRLVGGHLEHVGFSGKPYNDPDVFRDLDCFVFPAANHLREDADWTLLTGFLKTVRAPLIILGLGAQADHGADASATASRLRENRTVMEFVEVLSGKAKLITVRGAFSEAVCRELGLADTLRLGCPSQFLNPSPRLGVEIEEQLGALRNDRNPARVAMTASAPRELEGWRADIEARLFQWTSGSRGLYVQQSCEDWFFDGPDGMLARLDKSQWRYAHRRIAPSMAGDAFEEALHASFRVYFDARRWIDDLSNVDLVIGTRIHGNMAALAASRPGIVVSHDARVSELADEMHVPQVEAEAVLGARSYRDVLEAVRFDGNTFDEARGRKAGHLVNAFSALGIPASDHLMKLAAAGASTDLDGTPAAASVRIAKGMER